MKWKLLKDIDRELFIEPFTRAFDCFSVFAEFKGVLIIIAHHQIVCIKLSLTSDPNAPLKACNLARIKGINGKQLFASIQVTAFYLLL